MAELEVSLATIAGGALEELFAAEMSRVLSNIADPNTAAKAKRKIQIEVTFAPAADRDSSDVTVKCASKLAGVNHIESRVYIGRRQGKLVAVENDPRQSSLFDSERPQPVAVSQFPQTKGGE